MKSSLFFAAALLAAVSILLSCVSHEQREKIINVNIEQQSGQFLNYVSALNELYSNGTPADGDAKGRIKLPGWLPRSSSIQLQINNGIGYIFMPSSPGLYARLLHETDSSSHFGLSDAAGINTTAGRLTRPGFIPAGYVVYVR